jgi:hypothetical protein
MQKDYRGVIWTNHVLERMRERGIKQGDAWATLRRPDRSRSGKKKGTWVYYRNIGTQMIEVVAKEKNKEWIVLSVWSRPSDDKKPQRNTSLGRFLAKLFSD